MPYRPVLCHATAHCRSLTYQIFGPLGYGSLVPLTVRPTSPFTLSYVHVHLLDTGREALLRRTFECADLMWMPFRGRF
jgi:hypothetical protein